VEGGSTVSTQLAPKSHGQAPIGKKTANLPEPRSWGTRWKRVVDATARAGKCETGGGRQADAGDSDPRRQAASRSLVGPIMAYGDR